jgi:hypothetical protein
MLEMSYLEALESFFPLNHRKLNDCHQKGGRRVIRTVEKGRENRGWMQPGE